MPVAPLGKWGNSRAVRIPGELAAAACLKDGDTVDIVADGNTLVLRAAAKPLTAAGLLRGRSEAAWRAEYAGAFDWGADVGRGAVPE